MVSWVTQIWVVQQLSLQLSAQELSPSLQHASVMLSIWQKCET